MTPTPRRDRDISMIDRIDHTKDHAMKEEGPKRPPEGSCEGHFGRFKKTDRPPAVHWLPGSSGIRKIDTDDQSACLRLHALPYDKRVRHGAKVRKEIRSISGIGASRLDPFGAYQ